MSHALPPDRIPTPRSAPFEREREATVEKLQDAFAADELNLEEFDERMELARTARNTPELHVLLHDLPGQTALVPAGETALATRTQGALAPQTSTALSAPPEHVLAIFGGVERDGSWRPPRHMKATAVFGGIELDFREADWGPGDVVEVDCFALFGGIEIEVPPEVNVTVSGSGILGGFEHRAKRANPQPSAPELHVRGHAVLGGVEVKVKESKRRRRRRRDT